jgi:hypothetical protein
MNLSLFDGIIGWGKATYTNPLPFLIKISVADQTYKKKLSALNRSNSFGHN